MKHKDLLYNTGSYISYLIMPIMENSLKNNIYITESLCCTPKTDTELYMSYTNCSSIFFKKKNYSKFSLAHLFTILPIYTSLSSVKLLECMNFLYFFLNLIFLLYICSYILLLTQEHYSINCHLLPLFNQFFYYYFIGYSLLTNSHGLISPLDLELPREC